MNRATVARRVTQLYTAAELLDRLAADLDLEGREIRETHPDAADELATASSLAQQGWAHAMGGARTLRALLGTTP